MLYYLIFKFDGKLRSNAWNRSFSNAAPLCYLPILSEAYFFLATFTVIKWYDWIGEPRCAGNFCREGEKAYAAYKFCLNMEGY